MRAHNFRKNIMADQSEFLKIFEGVDGVSTKSQVETSILAGVNTTVRVMTDVLTFVPEYESSIEEEKRRLPFSAVAVLDVSGSMAGQPLDHCKAALCQIADRLREGDSFGLVTYASAARVDFRDVSVEKGNIQAFKDHVMHGIETRDMTNMGAGLDEAMTLFGSGSGSGSRHIFLFSDGKVNTGTNGGALPSVAASIAQRDGVTIHSLGIGEGYDEKLMKNMARSGNGGVFFNIAASASIPEAVNRCLTGVTRTVGTKARLFCRGFGRAMVRRGLYGSERDDPSKGFAVGTLRHRGCVRKVWEIEAGVTEAESGTGEDGGRRVPLCAVRVEYADPRTGEVRTTNEQVVYCSVSANGKFEVGERNEAVTSFCAMKDAEREQAEIYRNMKAGKIEEASSQYRKVRASVSDARGSGDIFARAQFGRFSAQVVDGSQAAQKLMYSQCREEEDEDEDMGFGLFE